MKKHRLKNKLAMPMKGVEMYPHTFSGLPALQVKSEFDGLLKVIREYEVKSILEIGSARGDSLHEMAVQMPKGSKVVSIDYPMQQWGIDKSEDYLDAALKALSADYQCAGFKGSSRDEDIIWAAESSGPYDLVFIDGDHTYDGVKADWQNYGKMGKIVAFHDIADSQRPNRHGEVIEVPRFWNELKKQYRHVEFIEKGSTMGIGIIFRD